MDVKQYVYTYLLIEEDVCKPLSSIPPPPKFVLGEIVILTEKNNSSLHCLSRFEASTTDRCRVGYYTS